MRENLNLNPVFVCPLTSLTIIVYVSPSWRERSRSERPPNINNTNVAIERDKLIKDATTSQSSQ